MKQDDNRVTEQPSPYEDLRGLPLRGLLEAINREDAKVHRAVARTIPVMERLVEQVVARMERGGRMFYIGAGTSGRLAVTDASELPPTYGIPFDRVIGLIAGGDGALRRAVEHAEDDLAGAWRDMMPYAPCAGDVLVGVAASGTTPYVVGGLREARRRGLLTAAVVCNPASAAAAEAEYALEAVVGPEFVTGSTRMKAGTAQKMMLNMLSTAVMIRLGHVSGNRMVDMQLTNDKLVERGARLVAERGGIDVEAARGLLLRSGSVRRVLETLNGEDDVS
ncbi:N-acetylmuramic acid 6-phosphate etherase [Alistipes sp.]|uniref:N-acetylmuramic acid 6-phosphate etherase n=1 Tax=Alistipes sp. TaxID=1872444 RepID=UPI003AB56827